MIHSFEDMGNFANYDKHHGHVMFYLLYKHQWTTKLFHLNSVWCERRDLLCSSQIKHDFKFYPKFNWSQWNEYKTGQQNWCPCFPPLFPIIVPIGYNSAPTTPSRSTSTENLARERSRTTYSDYLQVPPSPGIFTRQISKRLSGEVPQSPFVTR